MNMAAPSVPERLNGFWKSLLSKYPDGVSNTSTTKYKDICKLLSEVLGVPIEEIYATGAKTRSSNFDTRFVQGNQAGKHTKIGVAFMQGVDGGSDIERFSNGAVTTSRKFVDGSDNTSYDAILIFVESSGILHLKRVLQREGLGYFDILKTHFPEAQLESIAIGKRRTSPPGPITDHPGSVSAELADIVQEFIAVASTAGVHVHRSMALRFASSLLAKRFLILTGLSGSGKTKVGQAFARWITADPGFVDPSDPAKGKHANPFVELVPVGADWTGNENILGYPNGLDASSYITKPALDLILHASANGDIPHFLILDEMNLSHVERYFSDLLSLLESGETIALYCDKRGPDGKPSETRGISPILKLPKNLFIIGTVNVDETTYMFSPKVLDRANVIEFRMSESDLEKFLGVPAHPDLSKLDGKGASFGPNFVVASSAPVAVHESAKPKYDAELLLAFKILQGHGAEFGFRTAYESARFVHFYKLLGGYPDADDSWFLAAFDCLIFQKILPKLHGSRSKLGPLLKKLWHLCVNDSLDRGTDLMKVFEDVARSTEKSAEPNIIIPASAPYPMSAEKVGRMWRILVENGFTSFAEA